MVSLSKRLFAFAVALAIILILGLGARRILRSREASVPISSRTVMAVPVARPANRAAEGAAPNARIPAGPDKVVLDTVDLNLDTDEDLEQVVVVRDTIEPYAPIEILIADFRGEIGLWLRQWSVRTEAVNPVSFAIQVKDLRGDGGATLVCFGLDAKNRQTIGVFGALGPAYMTLFSGSAERIELLEPTQAAAAAIVADRAMPTESDPFAMLRTIYRQDPRSGRFEPESESLLPGQAIGLDLASRVLTGDVAVFETYLGGLWEHAEPGRADTLIDFDVEGRRILCNDPSSTQVFVWKASSPASMGMLAATVNETLPDLIRLVEVRLAGADRISVRVLDAQVLRISSAQPLNGEYRRVRGNRGQAGAMHRLEPLATRPVQGTWIADSGFLLSVEGDRFRARGLPDREDMAGAVSLFRLDGAEVLDLHPLRSDGTIRQPLRFHPRLAWSGDPRPVASHLAAAGEPDLLFLIPVEVSASGVGPRYTESMRLRRAQEDRAEKAGRVSR